MRLMISAEPAAARRDGRGGRSAASKLKGARPTRPSVHAPLRALLELVLFAGDHERHVGDARDDAAVKFVRRRPCRSPRAAGHGGRLKACGLMHTHVHKLQLAIDIAFMYISTVDRTAQAGSL